MISKPELSAAPAVPAPGATITAIMPGLSTAATGGSEPTLMTADQRRVDEAALLIMADPQVTAAKAAVLKTWSSLPAARLMDGQATLPGAVDELTYLVALTAAQRVLCPETIASIETPPGTWGEGIPGSRWALDNADRIYRIATVDPASTYVIEGKRNALASNGDFSFDVTVDGITTLATLKAEDIDVGADGAFTILLDATPTAGRRNHMTLPPRGDTMVIRDTFSDWDRQLPNRLTIRKLGSEPTKAGLFVRAVQVTISLLQTYARFDAMLMDMFRQNPINQLVPQVRSAENGMGGTVNAASPFNLKDDEALVLTIDPQGANYVGLHLTDPWLRSIPFWNNISSLSIAQARRGPDGSITVVIAVRDPGYANWMSTNGLNDGFISLRMEDIRASSSVDPLKAVRASTVVKISQLPTLLPPYIERVNADQRARQLAAREAGFRKRLIE